MPDKAAATVFGLYLAMVIIGVSYLCFANIYSQSYTGILQRGYVYADTSCSTHCDDKGKNCHTTCSNTYYVREVFLKNAYTTSTCTVQRLTPYYFQGDADNFVSRMVLGTTRKLYETTYSHGTCIDDKIREQYNIIGSIFLTFPNFVILVILSPVILSLLNQLFRGICERIRDIRCRFPSIDCSWITSCCQNVRQLSRFNSYSSQTNCDLESTYEKKSYTSSSTLSQPLEMKPYQIQNSDTSYQYSSENRI